MSRQFTLPFYLIDTQQKPTTKKKNIRYNAFTMKAYAIQSVKHDVGKPPPGNRREPIKYNSLFKRDFIAGRLPFEIDYSNHMGKVTRFAWKKSIQQLDLTNLLPLVIYGLADSNAKYADLAELTLTYILNHAHRSQLYESLCHLVIPFRFIFRSYNKYAITVGLRALAHIVSSLYHAGKILIPEYQKIISPLTMYLTGPEEKLCDDIFYGQWHSSYLTTTIENALRLLEISGTTDLEQYSAFVEIKKALPSYESVVFPFNGAGAGIFHEKESFNEFPDKSKPGKSEFDQPNKNHNLRLIDINIM